MREAFFGPMFNNIVFYVNVTFYPVSILFIEKRQNSYDCDGRGNPSGKNRVRRHGKKQTRIVSKPTSFHSGTKTIAYGCKTIFVYPVLQSTNCGETQWFPLTDRKHTKCWCSALFWIG
uniref:Uncharacterized protein n=1 Tax=Sipha flava TaxID=143950 RepID=A0A2S2Q565_9HEMI